MAFSQSDVRAHAVRIILEHARDIENLSISEMLEDLELNQDDHDELCDLVDEAIRSALIVVGWDLNVIREQVSDC